jgi:nucleoside-diphosphate-sugar epimerase
MERVLVTGAGGYIGTSLVPMLLAAGYKVRALDRFFFGRELMPQHEQLEMIQADSRRLDASYLDGVDHVIDLVAISNDPSGELFQDATYQINHESRVHCATLAKAAGVKRYVLPSSCSIYGFQDPEVRCDETYQTNPLTTYAKANELAEHGVLPLADDKFCVVVLRQATVYGYSPRMRFDLAINGMTFGAWKTGVLPLMRDGTQWRPMVHVRDTASAQMFMLAAPREQVNGQLFNVGSDQNNYQLGPLAEEVCATLPKEIRIDW